jgi:hypothetical protein
MTRTVLAAAVIALIAAPAGAYTFPVYDHNGTLVHPHWRVDTLPVVMQINDQIGPGLPNVTDDSDPMAALTRALGRWPAVCGVSFQQRSTSVASGGNDGINLITFAATPENQQALEMAGEPIALTLIIFNPINGELMEADLLFNPASQFTTTMNTDADLSAADLEDIEAVATHELGHAIGLHHTGVESAAMWPIASVLDRQPDADDIAGARTLYPVAAPSGTISGVVTVDAGPAFGAHVVALGAGGAVAASALTLPGGTYAIEGLPPDTYTVYVEPFDGPQSVTPDGSCVHVGNLSGAGIYDGATLSANFATTFAGGNDSPAALALDAGGSVQVDFVIASGADTVNPTVIGPATVEDGGYSATVGTHALSVSAGTEQWIAVAGPGLDQVSPDDISFYGPGISVDAGSVIYASGTCGGALLPFLIFRTVIAPDAVGGGRSLTLKVGSQVSMLTGGVRIAAPPPCDGDCNADAVVTIDELLVMVNIALGNVAVQSCTPGDANGDGRVTVDEILAAVNNALNGCQLVVTAAPSSVARHQC